LNLPPGSRFPNSGSWQFRLAFVSFLTTSWFFVAHLRDTHVPYLGLATAAIVLQRNVAESAIRKSWIFVTLAVEASTIAFIYLVVRLRM